jgi:hypothetical protein
MKFRPSELIAAINDSINPIPVNKLFFSELNVTGKNEFLFFLKPELMLRTPPTRLDKILELILGKIDEFDLQVRNIRVINAAYLEKHTIIAQHYGVINKLSSHARDTITSEGITKFEQIFSESYQKAEVLGSLEFLAKYPHFTPTGLSYLWQNCPTVKLAGGTYAQKLNLDGKISYLVNGFHPRQLEHFIAKDRCIVTMTLAGDIDWSLARNKFIGRTNPLEAEKGSIRRELFDGKDIYELQNVSASWNGVHLSAGPVEGLVELIRYNSDFENNLQLQPENYAFGKQLIQAFDWDFVVKILENPAVVYENKETSVFDLTEEKNSEECVGLLGRAKIK